MAAETARDDYAVHVGGCDAGFRLVVAADAKGLKLPLAADTRCDLNRLVKRL